MGRKSICRKILTGVAVTISILLCYLVSFWMLVEPIPGTRCMVGLPEDGYPPPGGRVLSDGQFLPYDQDRLHATYDPELYRAFYYLYYPIHKWYEATGKGVFVRDLRAFGIPDEVDPFGFPRQTEDQ